jgi:hypothetical protein
MLCLSGVRLEELLEITRLTLTMRDAGLLALPIEGVNCAYHDRAVLQMRPSRIWTVAAWGQRLRYRDGVDAVHRASAQQVVPDGPPAERRGRRDGVARLVRVRQVVRKLLSMCRASG